MNKLIYSLVLSLAFLGLRAQPTFSFLPSSVNTNVGEEFSIDVQVEDFTDIAGMQYAINWDPAVAEFVSITNVNGTAVPGLDLNSSFGFPGSGNVPPGKITLSWSDPNFQGVDVPDGTVIYTITLRGTANGNTTLDITNDSPGIEILNGDFQSIGLNSNPSNITVGSGGSNDDFTINVASATVDAGQTFCLEVSVENFADIIGMQFTIEYDPAQLQFSSVGNFNLQDLNASAFGLPGQQTAPGTIILSWFDQSSTGVTVPDGTVIFEVCFTAVGSGTSQVSITGSQTAIEVIDVNNQLLPVTTNNGTVTIQGGGSGSDDFTLTIGDADVQPGETFCLPVTVQNYDNILSIQLSINYDPSLLQFENVQAFNLPGLNSGSFGLPGTGNNQPGELTLSYFDDQNPTGSSVPDGTVIFEVCFTALAAGTTTVDFSGTPTPIEVTDGSGNTVQPVLQNGTVNIGGTPSSVSLDLSEESANLNETACVEVRAQAFQDVASLQFSISYDPANLQFDNITGINLSGLTLSDINTSTPGQIAVDWDAPGSAGVGLSPGTVIFEICFTALQGGMHPVTFSDTPLPGQGTNGNGDPLTFNGNNGSVSVTDISCTTGDPTFIIADASPTDCDPLCIPVQVACFEDIASAQFSIGYNASVLQLDTITGFGLPGLSASNFNTSTPGQIGFFWFDQTTQGQALSDGSTLFEMCFTTSSSGSTSITFTDTPVPSEVVDGNLQELTAVFDGGQINLGNCGGVPSLTLTAQNATPVDCDNFCVPIRVSDFADVASLSFSMTYNPGALNFLSAQNQNPALPGLNVSNPSNGVLTVSWSGGSGVDLPDDATLLELCFEAPPGGGLSTPLAFANSPLPISAVNASGSSIPTETNDASISLSNCALDGLSIIINDGTADNTGETVCVPVTVANFDQIVGAQFTITYDPSLLEFENVQNLGLPGLTPGANFNGSMPGILSFQWLDLSLNGVTLPNGSVLFEMCYTVLANDGSCANFDFSDMPVAIEFIDVNGQVIPDFNLIPGSICVGMPDGPMITSTDITDVLCRGDSTGSIDIEVTGGSGSYTYQWDYQGATTQDLTNVPAGTYSVTVTDPGSGQTVQGTFTVNEPASGISINQVLVANNDCFGGTEGQISVMAIGGTGNLTYSWNNGLPNGPIQGDLPAGMYTVTVTDQAGCSIVSMPIPVTQPDTGITLLADIVNAECLGQPTGSISVTPQGGTTPYQFDWEDPLTDGTSTQSDLNPGTYGLTVTDGEGCTQDFTLEVDANNPVNVTAENIIPINPDGGTPGTIDINVDGGSGNYTFDWTGPAGFSATTEDISGLNELGEYCVVVDDGASCLGEACFILTERFRFDDISIQRSCAGDSSGSISVIMSGGLQPYGFSWNTGDTTATISGIPPGSYQLTVTDAQGETRTGSFDVTSFPAINVDANVTPVTGNPGNANGAVSLNISGGTPSFTFLWDDGATTPNRNNLTTGTYCVTVTDNIGCTQEDCFEVDFSESGLFWQLTNTVATTCPSDMTGSLALLITGGEPPYTIVFDDDFTVNSPDGVVTRSGLAAGTYGFTVTDNAGTQITGQAMVLGPSPWAITPAIQSDPEGGECEGSISLDISGGTNPITVTWPDIGQVGPDVMGLCAGDYRFELVDANGCTFSDSVTVSEFGLFLEVSDASCPNSADGRISVGITGGQAPFAFEWRDAEGGLVSTAQELSGVPPGTYTLFLTDALNNRITGTATIASASQLALSTTVLSDYDGFDVSCPNVSDGVVQAEGQNSSGYAYTWLQGGAVIGTGDILEDAPAGPITVEVADELGCVVSQEIVLSAPAPVFMTAIVDDVTCHGEKDGQVVVQPDGGMRPYTYSWSTSPSDTTPRVRFLFPGTYTVSVTDGNNCVYSETYEISQPAPIQIVALETVPTDNGNDGRVEAIIQGGTPPYFVNWLDEMAGEPARNNLSPGEYCVRSVEDARGCRFPDPPGSADPLCALVNDGNIECFAAGRKAITPDGDGLNDEFLINCVESTLSNRLEVFNRWGQLVFEAENYANDWEGTAANGGDLPSGAYYFVFRYDDGSGEEKEARGSLTIVR